VRRQRLGLRRHHDGAEFERIRCLRKPEVARVSHDGTRIAVAYEDQGVEVFQA
jgi:hypothetical protein